MGCEVFAVMHMVQGSGCYIVWNYYFFTWLAWRVGGGVPFGDEEAVRSDGGVPNQKSDFIV